MQWKVILGISVLLLIFLMAVVGPFIAGEFHHLGDALQTQPHIR